MGVMMMMGVETTEKGVEDKKDGGGEEESCGS